MKTIACRSLVLAVIVAGVASRSLPQSNDKVDSATISGRVLVHGKGLGGVVVGVGRSPSSSKPQILPSLRAKTDADGNYAMTGLPAGTYYLSVSAPGFIGVTGGGPNGDLRPISVMAGGTAGNMDFQLVRGGVVSGRVTTKDGEPMVEQPINLIPLEVRPAPSFAIPSYNLERTDDRGIYRIFGIPAGRYKVAAGPAIPAYGSYMGRRAYTRVFYPDVVEESKAKIVEVKEGSENIGIDITGIVFEPTFSISGRIIDSESGVPVPNVMCGLEVLAGEKKIGGISGPTFSDDNGRFIIENIPAGRYMVDAPSIASRSDVPASDFFGNSAQFEVVDKDVTGIVVQAKRGASVSGYVALENMNDKATWARLVKLRLNISSVGPPGSTVSGKAVSIGGDGSFTVSGLRPGSVIFSLSSNEDYREAIGFRWRRLEHNGVEKTEKLQVAAGEQITNVRLVYLTGNSSLDGVVKCEPGPCPQAIRGTARLFRGNTFIAGALVDTRGNFYLKEFRQVNTN